MNRPAAMLGLCLLVTGASACTTGISTPLDLEGGALTGTAGKPQAGSTAPRGGTGGMPARAGSGGNGGRSELQAGNGGMGDRPDQVCEDSMDPAGEAELAEALNMAIENKTFCPDARGPGLSRLTPSADWRCAARNYARFLSPDHGPRGPGAPAGWVPLDGQTYMWTRRQAPYVADAKNALFSDDRTDHRDDFCASAQRASTPYKSIGVGHIRDTWVIYISQATSL